MLRYVVTLVLFAAAMPVSAAGRPNLMMCVTGDVQTCSKMLLHEGLSDKDRSLLYSYRAIKFFQSRELSEAMSDLARAIDLNPGNAVAWQLRCNQRANFNFELERALADCDEAIRINARAHNHHSARGKVLLRLSRLDEAIASFDQALAIEPNDPFSRYLRGVALRKTGNRVAAEKEISRAREANAEVVEQLVNFGFK